MSANKNHLHIYPGNSVKIILDKIDFSVKCSIEQLSLELYCYGN